MRPNASTTSNTRLMTRKIQERISSLGSGCKDKRVPGPYVASRKRSVIVLCNGPVRLEADATTNPSPVTVSRMKYASQPIFRPPCETER